jgi:hypothetical protein
MTTFLFVLSILLLTLEGLVVCRLYVVEEMDAAGRLAVAFATGLVINTLLLSIESALGIEWTRVSCFLPAAVIAIAGILVARRVKWFVAGPWRGWIPIAGILLLMTWGVATARVTCGDLLYFWGPKAVRFAAAGKIDVAYLTEPWFYLAHKDYPPLIPLQYVWGILGAKQMSYPGALLLLPLTVLATVAAFRGFARRRLGDERSLLYALLLTAVLVTAGSVAMVGGAADMMLVFFAVIALSALTFADDHRSSLVIAAIALLGCVMTKVEGASLAAIIVFSFAITRRRIAAAAAIFVPALLFIGAWLGFLKHSGLTENYSLEGRPLHLEKIGLVIQRIVPVVNYRSFYLPWFAATLPMLTGRRWDRAALPLVAGIGLVASIVWVYLHGFPGAPDLDPTYWIRSSADRVMLTALAAFVVATAAANE